MIKILYWNIKQKGEELLETLTLLTQKQEIDILILSEISQSPKKRKIRGVTITQIIDNIGVATSMKFIGTKKESWIYLWVKDNKKFDIDLLAVYDKLNRPIDLADIETSGDSEYFAQYLNQFERMLFYKVSLNSFDFLLTPIHFPSRIFATTSKQKDISVHFKNYIEKVEKENNLKSIVVGDFNMNPFEPGMIHHEGFQALPSQNLAETKEFYGVPYKSFYNPTWEKYGDYTLTKGSIVRKPSGSYYFENSRDLNYYWYILDQVIMRKELIPHFCFEHFHYVTSIETPNDLLKPDLSPNDEIYSDHLPITFSLK